MQEVSFSFSLYSLLTEPDIVELLRQEAEQPICKRTRFA